MSAATSKGELTRTAIIQAANIIHNVNLNQNLFRGDKYQISTIKPEGTEEVKDVSKVGTIRV